TTRPGAYVGQAVLQNFEHVWIDPLDESGVSRFLERWCDAVFPTAPHEAHRHFSDLSNALFASRDIRRMARTPIILTALALVHWNERRIPEQRADLYGSVIQWLTRSRPQRVGRLPAERSVVLLQELALAMQCEPSGRQVQTSRHWAAEAIAAE